MNAVIRRTPTVVDTYGHTLTLAELLGVLKMSRTAAKRRFEAGTFPIPALPRRAGTTEPYRFAALQVDRYLARAMDGAK
jgi:hypothetical protein